MDKSEQTRPKDAKRGRYMYLLITNTPHIDAVRIQRLSMSKMGFGHEKCLFYSPAKKISFSLPSTLDPRHSTQGPRPSTKDVITCPDKYRS